jgi:hypothetical protein
MAGGRSQRSKRNGLGETAGLDRFVLPNRGFTDSPWDFGDANGPFPSAAGGSSCGAEQHLIFAGVMCFLGAHNLK